MSTNEIERDAKLIERALNYDEGGFDELHTIYEPGVFRFAYFYLMNREDAEEITQNTFFTLSRKLHTVDTSKPIKGLLFSFAYGHIRNYKRNIKMESIENFHERVEKPSQEEKVIIDQIQSLVLEELKNFDPETRITLLEHLEDKELSEISETLKTPLGTIKARICRARETLRKRLRKFL